MVSYPKVHILFSVLACFFTFSMHSVDHEVTIDQIMIDQIVTDQTGSIQLERVQSPTALTINTEKTKVFKRSVKKYAVTAGMAVCAAVVLYTAHKLREVLQAQENNRVEAIAEKVIKKEREQDKLPVTMVSKEEFAKVVAAAVPVASVAQGGILSGLQGMAWSSSKFFADSAFMLTTSVVLNGAYQYMHRKIAQTYQDETILWYVAEETKINQIFNDLKYYSIEYDLYASLLSAEMFNQDAQTHMRAFVRELVQTTRDYVTEDAFQDSKYLSFLLGEMKKKYVRKCGELEGLQAYVVPAAGMRQRALTGDDKAGMFVSDENRRKDITKLCRLLAKEVERLTAFMAVRLEKKSDRIGVLVASCNAYLDRMETLLNASSEQLIALSKADRGMFTCSYEFERVFAQQLGHIHRYCKLVE